MTITENDYYQKLHKIARDAAKERAKLNANINETAYSKDDEDKYHDIYVRKLANRLQWAPTDEFYDRFSKIENAPASTLANWMMGGETNTFNEKYNPENLAKKAELEKFMPLVAGVAKEGEDWLSTDGSVLRDLAAQEYGYKRKDFPQFLDKLREYQTQFDRAKLWDEYKKQSGDFNYALDNLLYPSAMQELQNAILTGEGSEDAVNNLAYMDKVSNLATAAMPSVPVSKVASPLARLTKASWIKSPMTSGAVQAALQGATEAGRQGMKENLSETGQEFDTTAPFVAAGMGATAPGMIGTLRQLVSQSQGKAARDFGRGLMKATRYGDPVAIERNGLEDLLNRYNNFTNEQEIGVRKLTEAFNNARERLSKHPRVGQELSAEELAKELQKVSPELASRPLDEVVGYVNRSKLPPEYKQLFAYPLDEMADINTAPKVKSILEYLGSGYEGADGKVLVDKVLNAYDSPVAALTMLDGASLKPATSDVIRNNQKIARAFKIPQELFRSKRAPKNAAMLGKESLEQFQQLFPAKAADAFNKKTGAYKSGEVIGQLLQNAGGRLEPTIKINPFGSKALPTADYTEQSWYKKLEDTENGQVLRKLIEEALKEKKKKN